MTNLANVDGYAGYTSLSIDPLCYPWWTEQQYDQPMKRWEREWCDEIDAELWAGYVADWLAYHESGGVRQLPPPGRRVSFQEALEAANRKFGTALQLLADESEDHA
jgi:hypothetical protein